MERGGGGGGGWGGMNNELTSACTCLEKKGSLWSFFPAHVTLIFSIRAATTS